MSAESNFEAVSRALTAAPGVTTGKMFGAPGLRVGGKFFACLVNGALVVKLPRERVETLTTAGQGQAFDSGMGRTMKEWLAVPEVDQGTWMRLTEEAHQFVASQAGAAKQTGGR